MYCKPPRLGVSRATLSAAFAALLLAACATHPAPPRNDAVAFLRFENLGADPSADWIGRAIPFILSAELADAPNLKVATSAQIHTINRALGVRPISAPGISAERTAALTDGAGRIVYGNYWASGGKLHARIWVEDPRTQKITRTFEISSAAGDAIGAATQIARQFSSRTAAFSTSNNDVIRAYSQGMEAVNLPAAIALNEQALAVDPKFGPVYRTLAELYLQRQDRDAAKAILARGMKQEGLPEIERARIRVDAASLDNDIAAKQQALAALAKIQPRDAAGLQSLAQVAMSRHDYAAAEDAYKKALAIEPENTNVLNEYGYAAAYAGHFDEGAAALQKYHAMRPNDPNALDSLGDINLLVNRYPQAEAAYNEAHKINPNFNNNSDLFKAAMARAMTGDLAGAEAIYGQYIGARTLGHDANAPLLHSEWLWLTGRRKQGETEMLAFSHTAESHNDQGTASRAYSGIALWDLMAGDRAGALDMAQKAVAAAGPQPSAAVVIARFLAQPSATAEEWQSRTERFIPNPAQSSLRDQMLGFALLLDGRFEAARAPLKRLYDTTGSSGYEGITILLAWCDVQTGNVAAAGPELAFTPIPPADGLDSFMPLWFPRLFELRATVARKAGKEAEARQNLDLFAKLSGK